MNVLSDVIKAILAVLIVSLAAIAFVVLTVGVGYLFGMAIAITPFVSDWLTNTLPVEKSQIPALTAWFAILRWFVRGSGRISNIKAGANDNADA